MCLIHEILIKSCRDHPAKAALIHKDRRVTFQELDEASTKLANFLLAQGIGYGDRVGIFSTKNIQEIVALFAILKIGGIFVHINPHYKESQLSHIVSDCDIKALFIHPVKAPLLHQVWPDRTPFHLLVNLAASGSLEKSYPNVCSLEKALESPATPITCSGLDESDPAAIIYTSGSTGRPKGIIVTHKIFYDSTTISAAVLENTQADRLISVTPFSFDGALSQLFTALLVGGTLVLQESSFPKDVVETMLTERITGFHAVPSFWRMLLQRHSPLAEHVYPDLRYVSIIGETFPRADLLKLKALLDKARFFMMYGITEAFRSTFLHPDDFERKPFSVGKPFPGVEILIVNEQGEICPAGQVGEIVHTGVFVSPGYWNDARRTREVFRNGSLYTGDLGKMDAEGYLYFVGRKDALIKISGYRLNPEEIEACLYKMEGIKEAVVVSVPDEQTGPRLKAIISSEGTLTAKEVINHCKSHLPYYMVPSIVEFQTALPKTSTYKINRSQLS